MPEARWTEYDKTRALLADEWPMETQPSLYLQARLRSMDWDVDDFFSTFSRDADEVYGILDGTIPSTPQGEQLTLSTQLGALTGTSRTLWEVLMTRHRQYLSYMKLIESDRENVDPS